MSPTNTTEMKVKIYAPFKTYFEGNATSVSGVNDTGPFDILARHKNFMSLLKAGNLVVKTSGSPDFEMTIDRGVMHVKTNQVTVFLDL